MELIQDARNAREVRRALKLVAPFRIVWPTEADCTRALSDFAAYHVSKGLGLLDALIAACARKARVATVVTWNIGDFERFFEDEPLVTAPRSR